MFFLACSAPAWAVSGEVSGSDAQPIDITADRLEADDAARKILFLGHVVAKQGEMTLYAREMTVFLQQEGEGIERIEAAGDVRIVQGERVATGEKGVYLQREGKITLTGNAQVHQGKDIVAGDEIVVFLQEEKSIVKSKEGSRVRATFHPQDKKESGEQP